MKARPMTKKETVRYKSFIEGRLVAEGINCRDPRRLPRYGQDWWRGIKVDGGVADRRVLA